MDEFRHEKTVCRYGRECDAFIRLIENGYRKDDIGHCSIYFHEGRRGGMTIKDNFGLTKFVSAFQHWNPDNWCDTVFWKGQINDGDLVKELNDNGFDNVMKPADGPYGHLDEVVREKLQHPRHKFIGSPLNYQQMLSIILYCGTDAYADMRWDEIQYTMQDFTEYNDRTQNNLKKQKWPIFSKILHEAICCLDKCDSNHRPSTVYHGLRNIEIDPKTFNNHGRASLCGRAYGGDHEHFKYGTFISTSWDKEIALSFMGSKGSLLKIDLTDTTEGNRERIIIGADVSWISKFPIESEFLITRCATFNIKKTYFDENHNYEIVEVEAGGYCHLADD
ncbi:unnamed protein product [Rotaria sordida]|uniref:ADP ribosyltransferase domain-containing protein n=1 Tax=Rotaria sordida TaxID=392033 RepID=A0A818R4C9_9BILA|nr:unnamed protein product [Rotaria sordida]CAF3648894.1 unnamed protein product [Rotaria sordida]